MNDKNEKDRLESIASDSWYNKGANYVTIKYSTEIFKRHLKSGSILELGPAEGVMTEELVSIFSDYTVVDGSSIFCDLLKRKYPNITVVNSLFEQFKSSRQYDNIILGHVLEHVDNPVEILNYVKQFLSTTGIVLAAVPNANSIHRQAAVLLGLLNSIYDLNETDIHHGHRRVYDCDAFRKDFLSADLKIIKQGGYWLKPLSNKQIEEQWSDKMLQSFMVIGEKYPDIAAESYIVASK